MRKTCPHCGIDFLIDFAGARPDLQWAFAKCFGCHGLTLIDSRKGSPRFDLTAISNFFKSRAEKAPATPVSIPVPEPLAPLSESQSAPPQFYLKQIAIVTVFVASIVTLRWAMSGNESESLKQTDVIAPHAAAAVPAPAPAVARAVAAVAAPKPVEQAPAVQPVAPIVQEPLARVRVIVPSVILRSGPGTQYSKVATARGDSKLSVKKREGDWLEVDFGSGGSAWVRNDLVSVL